MKIALVINIALVAILVICVWSGYKKGLIMGIGSIIALIIALYGANLLATTFSYEVIPALKPFAGGFIESRISGEDGVVASMGWDDSRSVNDHLAAEPNRAAEYCTKSFESLGIDSESSAIMAKEALVHADENGTDMTGAVIYTACARASFVGCFIIAFLMIIIILSVLGNLPNLSYKLPNLDVVNDIGGTLLGVVTGAVFCSVLVWGLKFLGILIGGGTLTSSGLIKFFASNNIVTRFLGI